MRPPPAPAPAAPVPTNRGTAHIGLRVPDFDEAVAFFTERLGCELVFEAAADDALGRRLDPDPRPRARPRSRTARCPTSASRTELRSGSASCAAPTSTSSRWSS